MNKLLIDARKNKYAIGGFNFNSYDDALGIILAAYELKSPIILMASEGCINFLGIKYIDSFVNQLKDDYNIPIILHLDHGRDIEIIKNCIDNNFDSIMYDGSLLNLENNIKNTKLVADLCHDKGIVIEGELGRISGAENMVENSHDVFTDPDTVEEFIERSDVDSLAVSIGNAHGLYKGKPKLDFERLSKINNISSIPLVLHGGTGIPFGDIKKAITLGISKINVGTEIKISYIKSIKNYFTSFNDYDIRHLSSKVRNDIKELIKQYLYAFGTTKYGQQLSRRIL